MKKFAILLAALLAMSGPISQIDAQDNAATSTNAVIQGLEVADALETTTYYNLQVKDQEDQVVFEFLNFVLTNEELTTFTDYLKTKEFLYLDLGDGQYRLPVADVSLEGNNLTFVTDEKAAYQVFFHQGLVTNSGIIFQDPTDPVIASETIESPDFSQWIIENSAQTTEGPIMISYQEEDYWASLPYYTRQGGEEIDPSKNILVGAFTMSDVPNELHFNIVPRVDAPTLATSGQSQEPKGSEDSQVQEPAATSLETEATLAPSTQAGQVLVESQASLEANTTAEPATTNASPLQSLLPQTGEAGSWLGWLAIGLIVIAVILLVLPKIRRK